MYHLSKPVGYRTLPSLPRIDYKAPKMGNKSVAPSHASMNQIIENWWYERYSEPPTTIMQVDSYETCKEMVKNGLGYAIIPSSFVNKKDQLNFISLLNNNGSSIKRNTWLFYRDSSLEYPIVDRFVRYVKNLNHDGINN